MAKSAVGIIFSSLNMNTLSRLTSDRAVAAIPFACRYRLIDFCLSNMINANISNINIVANYNYRSLLEHIGSGKDWDLARRESGINFISPFLTATSSEAKMYSTHMEALKSMKNYISEFKEEYTVLMDSDTVLNIDISDVINNQEKNGAEITIVTKTLDKGFSTKHPKMMLSSVSDRVNEIVMGSTYDEQYTELSLGIYVMKTLYLKNLIEEAETLNKNSFTEIILQKCKTSKYFSYKYTGFVAHVSNFLDYYRYSMELVKNKKSRESLLEKKDSPIFTRVHNSAPTMYKSTAKVKGSMIADECVIEGTVINSILSRGVRIEKGATVKNCVLFRGTQIGRGASLNYIVTDKDVRISEGVTLSGNYNLPFYIQKGRKI